LNFLPACGESVLNFSKTDTLLHAAGSFITRGLSENFFGGLEMNKNRLKKSAHYFFLLIVLTLSGCSIGQVVKPWEKESLARPEMTFEGDQLDTKYTEHIYSSKEGASGGAGIGGGGCGCN
jgi:hypothetical protein